MLIDRSYLYTPLEGYSCIHRGHAQADWAVGQTDLDQQAMAVFIWLGQTSSPVRASHAYPVLS